MADITLLVLLSLETNYILLPQIIVLSWKEVLWYPKKIVFDDDMKILLVQDRVSNGKLKSETASLDSVYKNRTCELWDE